jgi:hypothetical protein
MNKTTVLGAALALLSVGLTGCNDLSTPEGVLYRSWNALKKEKVRAFKRTIRGNAADQYGNLVGMGLLLGEIRDLEFQVGESALVRTEQDRRGRDQLRVFEVEILARSRVGSDAALPEVGTGTFMPFKTAEVECDIDYVVTSTMNPTPLPPFPPVERELTRCWITELRAASL